MSFCNVLHEGPRAFDIADDSVEYGWNNTGNDSVFDYMKALPWFEEVRDDYVKIGNGKVGGDAKSRKHFRDDDDDDECADDISDDDPNNHAFDVEYIDRSPRTRSVKRTRSYNSDEMNVLS